MKTNSLQYVLLHGLGATAGVWRPLKSRLAAEPGNQCYAPDLPGHGAGAVLDQYDVDDVAATVAKSLAGVIDPERPVIVIGHSYGGVIALALASGKYGLKLQRVFCLGIKVNWSGDEVTSMARLAARPPKTFYTRDEAIAVYMKVAGIPPRFACDIDVDTAAREQGGLWRLSQDPATNAIEPPAMADLRSAAACPLHLARGEHDPMVSLDELRAFDKNASNIPSGGHNAMIDAAAGVTGWIASRLSIT